MKFFKAPAGTGPTAGVALDHAEIKRAKVTCRRMAGGDALGGLSTAAKLSELGLDWIDRT